MAAMKRSGLTRRGWLKALLSSGAALSGCTLEHSQPRTAHASNKRNLIRRENERTGTNDWLLTTPRIAPETKYRCPWIEGYCSRSSLRAGEKLSVFVSTNPASDFSLEIYR